MSTDKSIFGLRFGSTAEISPSQEELDTFLRSPKKSGRKELHGHDTASYGELLQRIRAFEQHMGEEPELRDKMFYFVLRHSRLVNLALKSAVEHYKYHLQVIETLDFKKPTAFITAAETEMGRLVPRKKGDAARLVRLWAMVDDRKKALAALAKRRDALIGELNHIARYVRDNLAKVEKLCETAIVVLVNTGIGRGEEGRIIAEVREHFRENLGEYRGNGPVSPDSLEAAGNEIEELVNEISRLFREDVYALASLYEAIHDRARKTVHEIDALLAQRKGRKDKEGPGENDVYARLEGVLVSLVSNLHFELNPAGLPAGSRRAELLREKRTEMLGRLFELLQKERRQRIDRRKLSDRRTYRDRRFKEAERRSGKERRSGNSRRKT